MSALLYTLKEQRKNEDTAPVSFIKLHVAFPTPIILRCIMTALNLSGIDTKIFTGHSTRTASSSKAKGTGVFTVKF